MTISWPEVEQTLCRIPHVTRARVVHDDADAVRELHIVATPGKHPKQLVRDVLSVAAASFGVDLDRNVVSVVQLEQEAGPAEDLRVTSAPSARTLLSGMTLQSEQGLVTVLVLLQRGEEEARGSSASAPAALGAHRLAAEATVDALRRLHPGVPAVDVSSVEVRSAGPARLALVTLLRRTPLGEDFLFGTAGVRAAGELDAVARAVLDAVNRPLLDARSA